MTRFSAVTRAAVATSMLILGSTLPAFAQTSTDANTTLVRVRILNFAPANQSDAIPALGVAANQITTTNRLIPDVDVSYFFKNPHYAAELVLTYPQRHVVNLNGATIGAFEELPPTLTAQYHFTPGAKFQPYIGVGVNETLISGVSVNVPGVGALKLASSSTGFAYQLGADFKVAPKRYVNIDVKHIGITTPVYSGSTAVSSARLNPWLFGIGYGIRL